ncbi:hypothetical protein OROMI_008293 [Orobanche minor]
MSRKIAVQWLYEYFEYARVFLSVGLFVEQSVGVYFSTFTYLVSVGISMSSRNRGGSVGSSSRAGGSCSGDGGCDWDDIPMGVVMDAIEVENGHAIEVRQEPEGTLVRTGVCSSGQLEGSQFTGFLLGENVSSKLSLKDMRRIPWNYDIPDHIALHVPSKEVRADWDILGMTCLYELPFKLGFRFPLPRLIREVCDFYEIAPGQLVSNAWRLLMALEVFCEMREIPITIKEVRSAYALKPTNAEKGKFQLNAVSLGWRLLGKMADCGKSWRGKYFFVPFNALGLPPDSEVPRIWNHARGLGYLTDPLRESIKNWIEYFVSLDEEDRKVENILTEANLRNSSLWKSVPPIPKGIAPPSDCINPWLLVLRRGNEITSLSSPLLFSNFTVPERAYADYIMSLPVEIPLGGLDALEQIKQKRSSAAGANAKGKSVAGAASARAVKKKRPVPTDLLNFSGDDIRVSFPSSASAISEFDVHSIEVRKLLFPEDREHFQRLGAGLSMGMFLAETVESQEGEIKEMKLEKGQMRKEIQSLRTDKANADKLLGELRGRLNSKEIELRTALEEVKSFKEQVAAMGDRVVIAALEAEIKLRAEMLQEYIDGRAETWDRERIFAQRDELRLMYAREATQVDDLADDLSEMRAGDPLEQWDEPGGQEGHVDPTGHDD